MKDGIIVEHVYKSFGKEKVLEDVNLTIEKGKILEQSVIMEAER
ncbi:hypothetical protein ACTNBM_12705 [Lachnospiraceae bacterium HCP1S3_C3]